MTSKSYMVPDWFYVSECLGADCKPFNAYKIRTMYRDSDKCIELLVNGLCDSYGKPLHDPRVTPIGRLLRAYWIDELPQLYNLAKGDLKLVGLRPTPENLWSRCPCELKYRALKQKPGLIAIDYAYPRTEHFSDKITHMIEYLDKYDVDPKGTDKEYLSRVIRNVLSGKVRSR